MLLRFIRHLYTSELGGGSPSEVSFQRWIFSSRHMRDNGGVKEKANSRRATVREVLANILLVVTLVVLFGIGVLVVAQVGFLKAERAVAAKEMLILMITLLLVVAILLVHIVRMGRERVQELTVRNSQLELEREQSEQLAVADERARIARDMHDIVAHSLTVLIAMSDGALATIDKNPQMSKEALERMSETARTALADTRRLVGVLRQPTEVPDEKAAQAPDLVSDLDEVRFTPSPDLSELGNLINQFRAAGLNITYQLTGCEVPTDGPLQLTIYRLVQESLTNVLRHAPASTRVEVELHVEPTGMLIRVFNATSLAEVTPSGGKGLIGMRERVSVYDGEVTAGPTPGGWKVEAKLKWAGKKSAPDTGWVMPE